MAHVRLQLAAAALTLGALACTGPGKIDVPPPASRAVDLSTEQSLIDEADAALEASDYDVARAKASKATTALLARPDAERDEAWCNLLFTVGGIAWDSQDLATAHTAWEQVLEVRTRTLSPDHVELQRTRVNLANALGAQGDISGARVLYEQALEVFSRTLPPEHLHLQKVRQNLASMIFGQGDLAGARALQEQVLEAFSRTVPPDDLDLQIARLNLARTRYTQGEVAAARALNEQAVEVYERTLPADHPYLQIARQNLASTLYSLGELTEARALQEQVLEVYSRTVPADHSDLQRVRMNLANTLFDQGDLPAARTLHEQVVEVWSRTLPPEHPDLQLARTNLASTLHTQGDLAAARALQEQVLEAHSQTLPPEHPDIQRARLTLASILYDQGDLGAAHEIYEDVLEVYTRTLPPEHRDVQLVRVNLATTLHDQGKLSEASDLQEEILDVYSRTLPPDHPDLQAARLNFAITLVARVGASGAERASLEERCVRLVRDLAESNIRIARETTLSASSREAEERSSSLQRALSNCISFASGYGVLAEDPELARLSFVLSEATRASALAAARVTDLARTDERCDGWREEIRACGEELARLVRAGTTRDAYDAVIARRDRAQRELVRTAAELQGAAELLVEPDPARISALLSEEDAIVAYRRYTRREITRGEREVLSTDSLCAFVLRKGAELRCVELGAMLPIEEAVKGWRDALGAREGRGIGVAGTAGDAAAESRHAARLAESILAPLRPALGDARRLVVVLDDVLNTIPFDALPATESSSVALLGDQHRIEIGSTVQESIRTTASSQREGCVVALGGADYGVEGFAYLPGTLAEARGVAELAASRGAGNVSVVLEGAEASRGSIEARATSARFLHLATHGWFAPESVRSWSDERGTAEDHVKGSSPMVLCGLALAGTTLVTAEEISGWDLASCELAVLSACDTNVGERRTGQGVASLQKALHMAGARSVITSLWKVPDEATKDLMLDFYRRIWIDQEPKAQALWNAKKRLRAAVDEAGRIRYSTRDWAAWVLTGDPR